MASQDRWQRAQEYEQGFWENVAREVAEGVYDQHAVMSEIRRLLSNEGFLYMTVNGRSWFGYWVHRALARLNLDPGHPHTFTSRRFRKLIERFGFRILQFDAASWQKAWLEDLTARSARARLKGLLLVSEHLLTAVARKDPD